LAEISKNYYQITLASAQYGQIIWKNRPKFSEMINFTWCPAKCFHPKVLMKKILPNVEICADFPRSKNGQRIDPRRSVPG
jgi:hypothetical protein